MMKTPTFKQLLKATKGQRFDTQLIYRLAGAANVNPLTIKVNVLYFFYVLTEGKKDA